jgi:hypothetical protein
MIFISETPSGPAYGGHFDLLQSGDDIVAYAARIGNGTVLSHPNASVDSVSEVFRKLTVDVFANGILGGICVHDERISHRLRHKNI